jgi:penicillin-binding protein 2
MDRENQTRFFKTVLVVLFVLLFGRLWQMQVLEYSAYIKLSQENTTRTIPTLAPRGIIYDRNGKVLVANRAVFSVYVFPSSLNKENINSELTILSKIVEIPADKIGARIEANKTRPFEPVLIKDNLSIKAVTAIEEKKYDLPGVVINVRPVRYYANASLAAHILGFVGEQGQSWRT